MKQGHGKQTYPDGTIYEGLWKDNLHHGWGRMVYPNNNIYEGEWMYSVACGKGIFKSVADGRLLKGNFHNGLA